MGKYKIEFKIRNLGPHTKLDFDKEINAKKIGIFASNGEGKTAISRAFRLASSNGFEYEKNLIHLNTALKINIKDN